MFVFGFQIFRLRKIRHEYLNLYTGVCSESLFLYPLIILEKKNLSSSRESQFSHRLQVSYSYFVKKNASHSYHWSNSSWIRGSTLFDLIHIQNESIPLNSSVQYAAQIAQAMSYLHEKSINHMSLRTSNIFVQNNRIVLTDYGLVPLSKCYRQYEDTGLIAPRGWLSYLAPEILRKLDPSDDRSLLHHTPQTDVYAFGLNQCERRNQLLIDRFFFLL